MEALSLLVARAPHHGSLMPNELSFDSGDVITYFPQHCDDELEVPAGWGVGKLGRNAASPI